MKQLFQKIEMKLLNYPRYKKRAGFETVKYILEMMNYKDDIPIIHVVGTNGKGSVVAMLSQILREKQIKVGVFTSPHLLDIRERIQVDGVLISKEDFISSYKYIDELSKKAEKSDYLSLTFFEWIFLMAINYWMLTKPDVIILEAGIGGGKDTTNVINNKLLTVITRIGMDHTEILGKSFQEIAKEKAGAIRKDVPTVIYNERKVVYNQIEKICKTRKSKLYKVLPVTIKILKRNKESIDFSFRNKYYEYRKLRIKSVADYQLDNVAIVLKCTQVLAKKFAIDDNAIKEGLIKFDWPGRMTYEKENLLLDGAHNVDGMIAFVRHINAMEKNKYINIIYASGINKDYKQMLKKLLDIKKLEQVYIPVTSFLSLEDAALMKNVLNENGFEEVSIIKDLKRFVSENVETVPDNILFGGVGSLYLVSELQKIFKEE